MSNEFSIENIFLKPYEEIELKKSLFKSSQSSIAECIETMEVVLDDDMWGKIIDGINDGSIKGQLDLRQKFGINQFQALAIFGSNFMQMIHTARNAEAKNKLLFGAVNRLEEIYNYTGDTDQAIGAINALAKIVGNSEKKDQNINIQNNISIESVLRNIKDKKGSIDI